MKEHPSKGYSCIYIKEIDPISNIEEIIIFLIIQQYLLTLYSQCFTHNFLFMERGKCPFD